MKLETITENISKYFSNNFDTYLKKESATITCPKKYLDGELELLAGEEVNFILSIDELDFEPLENTSDKMTIISNVFILFKLKQKNADTNKVIKQYVNAFYALISENNSLGGAVDYTELNKVEFFEVADNSQFPQKIIAFQINFIKEI